MMEKVTRGKKGRGIMEMVARGIRGRGNVGNCCQRKKEVVVEMIEMVGYFAIQQTTIDH
jgi:hypothetical protein